MASIASVEQKQKGLIVSVKEYREILNDHSSTEEQICKRIEYLEAFCRNIARSEIEVYVKSIKAAK